MYEACVGDVGLHTTDNHTDTRTATGPVPRAVRSKVVKAVKHVYNNLVLISNQMWFSV